MKMTISDKAYDALREQIDKVGLYDAFEYYDLDFAFKEVANGKTKKSWDRLIVELALLELAERIRKEH